MEDILLNVFREAREEVLAVVMKGLGLFLVFVCGDGSVRASSASRASCLTGRVHDWNV